MTAPDPRTLTKVTVNLTPRGLAAMDAACERTKDTKTDTINRALQVYAMVLDVTERSGGALTAVLADGSTERIHLC